MKVYYISNHGFGHMMRTIPHVEKILEETEENIYIASSAKQITFLKEYFTDYLERIIFSITKTDVGFINFPNSIEVNKIATEEMVKRFVDQLPILTVGEVSNLKNYQFNEIYVDISPLGILVGKQLNKKVIMMTNFTWYKQYEQLGLNKELVDVYKNIESQVDELWTYPLSFPLEHIHCSEKRLDFNCRKLNQERIKEIRGNYDKVVSVFAGMSAECTVNIKNFDGLIIHSENVEVNYDGPKLLLTKEVLDSHHFIAASDLVITKAGWTTVSECVCTNTDMVLIERPSAYEDMYIINELEKMNLGSTIKESSLKQLDLSKYFKN